MRILRHYILFLSLFIASCTFASAENMQSNDSIEAWDNSKVDYRCPSQDTISYYKGLPEYKYSNNKDTLSLWKKFWNWLFSHISISGGTLNALGWIILIIAIAFVAYLILRIIGVPIKGLFVFSKSTRVEELAFGLNNDGIESSKLEKQLNQYINNQAYREATRILFLICLRQLNRKGLIQWNIYKTDREYYYELKNDDLKEAFLNIIRLYEFIWFGKFNITQIEFEKIKIHFDDFLSQLQNKIAK